MIIIILTIIVEYIWQFIFNFRILQIPSLFSCRHISNIDLRFNNIFSSGNLGKNIEKIIIQLNMLLNGKLHIVRNLKPLMCAHMAP